MPAIPEPMPQPEPDRLETAADDAIAACGGDMRSAIRALILANEFFESQVKELTGAASRGYARKEIGPEQPLSPRRMDWYD